MARDLRRDKIGSLDQRITLQSLTRAPDGMGGSSSAWTNISGCATVWASARPGSAREALASDRVNAGGLYVFTIRNRDDLNEADRIVWRGENYNIRAVRRRGGRELYLEIEAERGVADVG